MGNIWIWYFGIIVLGFGVALIWWGLAMVFGRRHTSRHDVSNWERDQMEVDAMRDVRRMRLVADRKEIDALFRERVRKK